MRVRLAFERHGDWLVTCANLLQLSGFACTDGFYLQSLMIGGNGFMALFFLTRMPSMGVPFGWAMLKVFVNIFMVFKILHERQPIMLSAEEEGAYEEHFMHFGVTARQFKKFWDLGETRQLASEELLTVEGTPVESVSLVLSGRVYRSFGGKHIPALDTHPGAKREAGAWVGEITVMQLIDSESRRSSVYSEKQHDEDPAANVQKLQRTLASIGFYNGPVDGVADERTMNALQKLEERSGLTLDGIGGPKTQQALERFEKMLRLQNARWTALASEGVVVRCWKTQPLLDLCRSNAEMRGALRKAFSQSAVRKTIVMHQSATAGANDAVLRRYECALRRALVDGLVLPEDKLVLSRFRREHGVSETQHAAALRAAIGWSPEDYDHGAPVARIRDAARRSRVAEALAEEE